MTAGAPKVAIYSSHPDLGDPYEFVFYLEPPYAPEMVEHKRRLMEKAWIGAQGQRGLECRSEIVMVGPIGFFHDDRVDMSDKHMGDDEYLLKAFFRRTSPLIVCTDVIDMWAEMRRGIGAEVHAPVRTGTPMQANLRRVRNDIHWKAGATNGR